MPPISLSTFLLPSVPATDTGDSEALSAAINSSGEQGALDGRMDFRQVFQMLNMDQEGLSLGGLSFEQWQQRLAELTQPPEEFDFDGVAPEQADGLVTTLMQVQIPLEEQLKGQVLSTIQAQPGEALPPGFGMSGFGSSTTDMFNAGASGQLMPPQLKSMQSSSVGGSGLLDTDAHELTRQTTLNTPQVAIQAASSESRTSINAESVLPLNVVVNAKPFLNKNDSSPQPDLTLNRGNSKFFSHAGMLSQTPENPVKQIDSSATLSTHTQDAEQGLKATVDFRQGTIIGTKGELDMRTHPQLDFLSKDPGVAELSDSVDDDGHERPGSALPEVRARIQGTVLRQYVTGVEAHVNDPDWADQMSQKVVWLSGRNIQTAKLQLNPAELGPIEVKISVHNDQTTITFNAQHASVREMLETNLHRLREMMNENGVDLADVNVASGDQEDAHSTQQNTADDEDSTRNGGTRNHEENVANATDSEHEQSIVTVNALNLVDYYA